MTCYRCVSAGDWPASLEVGAIYSGAPAGDMLCVIDEDDGSYLYPAVLFQRLYPSTTQHAITLNTDTHTSGNILYAGTYLVEMPADYDPSEVTGEDVLLDDAITVIEEVSR